MIHLKHIVIKRTDQSHNIRIKKQKSRINLERDHGDGRFLGLFEGSSVAKVEEIVDSIGVDTYRAVRWDVWIGR